MMMINDGNDDDGDNDGHDDDDYGDNDGDGTHMMMMYGINGIDVNNNDDE